MSELMNAMQVLKKIFEKYAGKEGDKTKLNKSELASLLKTEIGIEAGKAEVDEFLQMLDEDKSGEVDFKEYTVFVATLTMIMFS